MQKIDAKSTRLKSAGIYFEATVSLCTLAFIPWCAPCGEILPRGLVWYEQVSGSAVNYLVHESGQKSSSLK